VGAERGIEPLSEAIRGIVELAQRLRPGAPVSLQARNFFVPGDTAWHKDFCMRDRALRMVWPLGRPSGMWVTSQDNVDSTVHRAFIARERPLHQRLDVEHFRSGLGVCRLWQHRPRQLLDLRDGRFPFVRDRERVVQAHRDSLTIHRIEGPNSKGTYHRSGFENRHYPGLQLVFTVG
jgi:hypothetical protein